MSVALQERIAEGVDTAIKHGKELVRLFLEHPDDFGSGFAGLTFDRLAPNESDHWNAADLVAVTLLDVRVRPSGVRALLEHQSNDFNEMLSAIRTDIELWSDSTNARADALDKARALYTRLEKLSGVGPVTASKLLARKRPRLVPIRDRVINKRLGLELGDEFWRPLGEVLARNDRVARIRDMLPPGHSELSELRALDVALWMLGSNSKAARKARDVAGIPADA